MRVRLCLLGALLMSSATLPAQHELGAQDAPVFRASTHLVTIDAVVTDGDGKLVTNLTPDDFDVTVSGRRQMLEQALYIRTQDQPEAWAAARAATAGSRNASPEPRSESAASHTLRTTGTAPDKIARTIAVVVDDLGLSFQSMFYVRNAIHKYIDTQIEPGDLVAIVRTAGGVGALQQFTSDKRLLHLAADRLLWGVRNHGAFASPDGPGPDEVDQLHDTLTSVGSMGALEYIARGVSLLPGRKCIIYFSEGLQSIFDDRMGTGESRSAGSGRIWRAMERMLSRANAAGVVIYTIDARGLVALATGPRAEDGSVTGASQAGGLETGAPLDPRAVRADGGFLDTPSPRMGAADRRRPFIASQESLRFLADQTGGLAIENTNDFNWGINRILDDQRGYYLLGYAAPADSQRAGWTQDRIKVRVKRPGLRIRARQGFFGPFDTTTPKAESADPLVMSALSPFGSGSITVRLTSMFAYDAIAAKAGSYVRSLLFIDPGDLNFNVDQAGKHTARFQVLVMAVGDNGRVLDAWRREVPLALTDETFQQIQAHGIVVTVRSAAKEPGPYQMRAAVEDLSSKRVGSAAQFLEVPEVGSGRLALSGVLLKGVTDSASRQAGVAPNAEAPAGLIDGVLLEPEVRVFSPGDNAVYAFEIYDGRKGDSPDLQMATAVIRDGKAVYQSPFAPVAASPNSGGRIRAIPVAATLALAPDMPAGPYTLEITIIGRDNKKVERKQWLDFEIRQR